MKRLSLVRFPLIPVYSAVSYGSIIFIFAVLLTLTFSGTPIGRKTRAICTGLFEMIVGVLTICHTQYT